jgi:hypothetical protein
MQAKLISLSAVDLLVLQRPKLTTPTVNTHNPCEYIESTGVHRYCLLWIIKI